MGERTMKQALYVCVYVPEMPAQTLLRLKPDAVGMAVAVMKGEPPLEQVVSVNQAAARMGIVHGMTRAELDVFEGLMILKQSAEQERRARSILLEAAGGLTPRVEIRPVMGCAFAMVLDMTGAERLFGQPAQMLQRVQQKLQALRFFVQLAASANLHAAVCLAPAARRMPILAPAAATAACLAQLPLHALWLSDAQAEKLSLWGLKTLGELALLPEVETIARLGQDGKRLRQLARGEHAHLMVPEEPVFVLEEYVAFDMPLEVLETLLFVVEPMLDQLLLRAQERAYALASVTVTLGLEGGTAHERTVKPALAVQQREVLMRLLQLDLQANPPGNGVLSILVHAEPGDRSKVQLGLFAPQLPEATRLDVTLARIAALVGDGRVGRARLNDTHKADSFAMETFTVTEQKTEPAATRAQSVCVRRCRPPVAIRMQQEGARLDAFAMRGKLYAVREAYGPWRRSGQWWSAEIWSMEEWDVRGMTSAGDTLLCLLSHDLLRNSWQMEALYD